MTQLIGPFRQILTMRKIPIKGAVSNDQLDVVQSGGVVIEKGRIVEVGEFEKLVKGNHQIAEIEGKNVLMPGLIDCHTHMVWGGSRAADFERRNGGFTYQQILEEGGGIFDTVGKTRIASKEVLLSSLMTRLKRHLGDGVTTVEIKSGYGLDRDNELKILEVIAAARSVGMPDLVSTFLGAHVCPGEFEKSAYLEFLLKEILPVIRERDLASRVDAFVEKEAFPVELARPYLLQAIKQGFDLTLHAGQFSEGGTALAVELGARSADHLESVGEKEIKLIANSNTTAVALPGASLGLGMKFTPARKLLDAGASLAIATDWNPGSAPMGDLLCQAGILASAEKLSAAEVLSGITFRAANALGLQDRGRMEPGLLADFISFDTGDYREILYNQGRLKPAQVWKKGAKIC